MKENLEKQTLPKWFDGDVYEEGGTVTNPFTGYTMQLSPKELSMYDFIKGSEMILEQNVNPLLADLFYQGMHWFRINNEKAYMVLLD
jgi:hypothetical protein